MLPNSQGIISDTLLSGLKKSGHTVCKKSEVREYTAALDMLCLFVAESWRGSGSSGDGVGALAELAARCVASHIPFELVERVYPPMPEQLQLRIAFWSFPDNEEDIRLYSCLANGSADEFQRGDSLFKAKHVKDALQIGK